MGNLYQIWRKTLGAIPGCKLRHWIVLERILDEDGLFYSGKTPRLELVSIDKGTLFTLQQINPAADLLACASRFEAGNTCYAAMLADCPVFYRWVFVNETSSRIDLKEHTDMHVSLFLPPLWIYLWDAWTNASQRGLGIQPAATYQLIQLFARQGMHGVVTLVERSNAASQVAFRKNGFRPCSILKHVRILGRDVVLDEYIAGSS